MLAEKLGSKQSRISNWNTGSASPRYAEIVKLIELGATAGELFGEERGAKLMASADNDQSFTKTSEFKEGVRQATIAAQEALLASLKASKP